jgi:glycosyltransferase involved in cell wall biosynthesis
VAGAEDWLGPGCGGFVVPQRDPAALAERICYLLNNPAEAAALGAAGQERVLACFDRQQLLDGVIEMWRQTVARAALSPDPRSSPAGAGKT